MMPMSNNMAKPEVNNDIVCEAIGCYSKDTNLVKLNIGYKRIISLYLCTKCKSKLQLGAEVNRGTLEHGNLENEEEDNA
jgi:hypothetical protein